jgi:lipopolysaccharide biosynthesis glycosyltransferase
MSTGNLVRINRNMNIFIGWDPREDIAYQVCKYSLENTANSKLNITPLKQQELRDSGIYTRDVDQLASTEFTFTRYLVPYLCNYEGWALFVDCDFLFLEDVEHIFAGADESKAVTVVKHDFKPINCFKMDGRMQTRYERKNWSSLILWNCSHEANRILTPDYINDPALTGKHFHRFDWLDDDLIGELNHEWNWLVGWHQEPIDGKPKALHYTEGGPWFESCQDCDYADVWNNARQELDEN